MTSRRYVYRNSLKKILARVFDCTGEALKAVRSSTPAKNDRFQKILVIRLDHIGDQILTRPALRLLKENFPAASLTLVLPAASAPLFSREPDIDSVVPSSAHWFETGASFAAMVKEFFRLLSLLKKGNYDLAIDFRGDLRHILLMRLAGIPRRLGYGITGGGFLLTDCPAYPWGEHQVNVNVSLLKCLNLQGNPETKPFAVEAAAKTARAAPAVVIHPAAGRPEKCWPWPSFLRLIQSLSGVDGLPVTLIGTASEKSRTGPVNMPGVQDLRGKTRLEDLPALFTQTRLFIGNDSGPAHIAAAQGIPVLCLFSRVNDPEVWKPWGHRVEVIDGRMSEISFEKVLDAAHRMLGEGAP